MNRQLFFVFLLLLIGISPAIAVATPAAGVARFAIVIGNNQPDKKGPDRLRFADDDAIATHQLMMDAKVKSHLLVTLDSDTQKLHPELSRDGAPRAQDLERVFASVSLEMRARSARGEKTELLLFYSGHGDAEHGEGYVVLEDQHLTRSRLFALLSRSPATSNHVFVDACKSYFLIYAKGPGGRRSAYSPAFVEGAVPGLLANTGFVLSTSSERDSHEWEHYQAGIFSYELRSALRGAADANLDGRINYAELGAFLTVANGSIENAKLRPDFMVRPPSSTPAGEILGWRSDTAALRLSGPSVGHLYVETALGERLLDVHPAPGELTALRLPRQRPLFVRKDDESAEYVLTGEQEESELQLALLTPTMPEVRRKGALNRALRRLFETPFGAANVREFELAMVAVNERPVDTAVPAQDSLATVAGWVAIGAGGAALTLSAASLATSLSSDGGSQVEIDAHNQRVKTLNIASAIGYAVAGVAGVTWGVCRLHLAGSPASAGGPRPLRDAGLTLMLDGRF
ncbi:MAG TPA: caspase family protein [Polyangiaceae bacterium]|nr:caspase family protein [Polyangiaceae bacterium]